MQRWFKLIVVVLSGLLLSGCSARTAKQTKQPTITIMAPYLTSNAPAKQGPVTQRLEKMTKTHLNFRWYTNDSYSDKVNVAMSASQLPDIIVFKEKDASFIKYAKSGEFWNLTKYLKKYPNLAKANPQVLRNSSINGQIYGIYRSRDIMRASVTLQKDWLKKLKLKTPTTLPELENVIRAFTEDDPDGNGKDDTYGMLVNKWYGLNNGAPWEIVATWLGAPNGWGERKDGSLYPAFMSPAYLKSLKWFRQAIQKGYINPDFATSTDSLITSFINQRGGSFIQPAYGMAELSERLNDQQLKQIYAFAGNLKASASATQHSWATSGYSGLLAIPKASVKTKAELNRILKFLDQADSKQGQVLMNNGIANQNFKVDPDDRQYGTPLKPGSKRYREITNDTIAISQVKTGVNANNEAYRIVSKTLQPIADKRYATMAADQKHAVNNEAAPYVSATYSRNGAVLDKIITDAQVQYMAGEIDDQQWQQAIDKWLDAGGRQVIREYSQLNQQRSSE